MKSIYSITAILCLFAIFVVNCSKNEDNNLVPPNTKTSTTQTGSTSSTTQTSITSSTTQTGTASSTVQKALAKITISGDTQGVILKVSDASFKTKHNVLHSINLTSNNADVDVSENIGKKLFFILEKDNKNVSEEVEKDVVAGDNPINLTVIAKKDNKQIVKIMITQADKPIADKRVFGMAGELAFNGIINSIALSSGQETIAEYQAELKSTTNSKGVATFEFKPANNITDYHFFIIIPEEPYYQVAVITIDGNEKEATITLANKVNITLAIFDSDKLPVEGAKVVIGEQTKITNEKGLAHFAVEEKRLKYTVTMPCGSKETGEIDAFEASKTSITFTTKERGEITLKNATSNPCTAILAGKNYEIAAGATKVIKDLKLGIYDADFFQNGKKIDRLFNTQLNCQKLNETFTLE